MNRSDAPGDAGRELERLGLGLLPRSTTVRWARRTDVETHLRLLGSHSYVAVAGRQEAASLLARERAELLAFFPDGVVEEAYRVDLTVARL